MNSFTEFDTKKVEEHDVFELSPFISIQSPWTGGDVSTSELGG